MESTIPLLRRLGISFVLFLFLTDGTAPLEMSSSAGPTLQKPLYGTPTGSPLLIQRR